MVVVMLHMQPVTSNCATLVPCREMMAAIPACPKSYLDATGSLSTAIRCWSSEEASALELSASEKQHSGFIYFTYSIYNIMHSHLVMSSFRNTLLALFSQGCGSVLHNSHCLL